MKVVYYSQLESKLDEKGAEELARELKRRNNYNARERKSRLNPAELKLQDELAERMYV